MKILLIAVAVFISTFSPASGAIDDGFYPTELTNLKTAYVNPSFDIHDYEKIFIKQPEITFDPKWEKKFGKNKTKHYRKRIARSYSSSLKTMISKKFSKDGGFTVLDQRAEGVLVVIPKMEELYIDLPDMGGIRDVLSRLPAGSAKIDITLYSPEDEAILGFFVDKRSTALPSGVSESKLSSVNKRAFRRLFEDWSDDILNVLELSKYN